MYMKMYVRKKWRYLRRLLWLRERELDQLNREYNLEGEHNRVNRKSNKKSQHLSSGES